MASRLWNLADMYYPDARQLLDFYHAAEHLHKTASELWSKETVNAVEKVHKSAVLAGQF
jgi:hypothetical protein